MAAVDLTAARLRELLHYEPESGIFLWLNPTPKNHKAIRGEPAGVVSKGYLVIRVDGVLYRSHRLAWLYMTGEWPSKFIDHRDTVRTNNAWRNLREADSFLNAQNVRAPSKNNATGLLGVFPARGGKFSSQIMAQRKKHCLGTFDTPEEAHAAYVAAKRRLHAGCTI